MRNSVVLRGESESDGIGGHLTYFLGIGLESGRIGGHLTYFLCVPIEILMGEIME
ncbi:MAG: hypothetical protein HQL69_24095 [Magnetococcales bacterium]|nr:hypothetical protein [Magnetococcales bacterium]